MKRNRRSPVHAYKRLLANDHDWDWCYLLALERRKLRRMRDYLMEHHTYVGWRENVREMDICLRCIAIVLKEDAVYNTWLHSRRRGDVRFRDLGNGMSELVDTGVDPNVKLPVYVNVRNERRFFRSTPIRDALGEGRGHFAEILKANLRQRKAMHLYNLIREYKMWEWWE